MGEVMRVKYLLYVHVCATEKKPQGYLPYVKLLASSCLGFRIILYCKRKEKGKPWANHAHKFLSWQKSLSSE